ncbi:cellulose binding domain-containing protein [Lentzea sp. NPDC003310]|uniref:cellulose binding domain-containing protein n=1 Tax=Lentzea sp. NPDC003310 TaxID=3154447 RepID=UPI0033A78D47
MAARKHILVLLTLLVAGCTAPQDGRPLPAPNASSSDATTKEPTVKVRAVVDARTVELANGTRARVSLLAEPSPCAAAAALDFATKTLRDKEVHVSSITPGEVSLALPDGNDYALLAVQYGFLRTTGVDGGPLVEAENKAQQAKLGLWAQGDCPSSTAPPTSAAPPPPAAPCVVVYRVTSQWAGAFQAEVTIRNVSGALVEGWTVAWRFGGGETVAQLWNGTVSQSGADVSVANAAYNALIVKDGSVTFGFNGSATGPTSPPGAFSVNGAACTAG